MASKMRLQKHISRVVGKTEYSKWVIIVPSSQIDELGWKEGEDLDGVVEGSSLVITPMINPRKKPKRMTYDEFKGIILEELKAEPKGLTWTGIKGRRAELYQRVPNNLWVRMMEKDIGLIREKKKGLTIWRLKE